MKFHPKFRVKIALPSFRTPAIAQWQWGYMFLKNPVSLLPRLEPLLGNLGQAASICTRIAGSHNLCTGTASEEGQQKEKKAFLNYHGDRIFVETKFSQRPNLHEDQTFSWRPNLHRDQIFAEPIFFKNSAEPLFFS